MNQDIKRVKIKSIKAKGVEDVYNMEVKNTHCFAVNGGYIVHNCRYGTEPFWHNNMYSGRVMNTHGFDMMRYLGL